MVQRRMDRSGVVGGVVRVATRRHRRGDPVRGLSGRRTGREEPRRLASVGSLRYNPANPSVLSHGDPTETEGERNVWLWGHKPRIHPARRGGAEAVRTGREQRWPGEVEWAVPEDAAGEVAGLTASF